MSVLSGKVSPLRKKQPHFKNKLLIMKASEHQLNGLKALRECMIKNDIILVKTANENKLAITVYDGSSDAIQFVNFSFEEEINPEDIENGNYEIL